MDKLYACGLFKAKEFIAKWNTEENLGYSIV
jgi:hypothetical protein